MPKSTFMRTAAAAGFAASVLLQVTTANSQEADSGSTASGSGTLGIKRLSVAQQTIREALHVQLPHVALSRPCPRVPPCLPTRDSSAQVTASARREK
jgi:hypothetical protein